MIQKTPFEQLIENWNLLMKEVDLRKKQDKQIRNNIREGIKNEKK